MCSSDLGHETNHLPFHVAVENGEVTSASRTMFRTNLNWYLAKPIHDCQAVQSPITPRLHPADSKNVRGEITQAPREEDEVEVSKELGCVWRNKQGRKHSESRRAPGLGWLFDERPAGAAIAAEAEFSLRRQLCGV